MGGQRGRRRLIPAAAATAVVAAFMTLGVTQALATTVACGQVITQDTHVSNDLLNCPGDGLVIGAPNIKLDLGGHLIDGDGINTATDDGIDNTGGFNNVRIEHGTIQQFSQGVHLTSASRNKVKKLRGATRPTARSSSTCPTTTRSSTARSTTTSTGSSSSAPTGTRSRTTRRTRAAARGSSCKFLNDDDVVSSTTRRTGTPSPGSRSTPRRRRGSSTTRCTTTPASGSSRSTRPTSPSSTTRRSTTATGSSSSTWTRAGSSTTTPTGTRWRDPRRRRLERQHAEAQRQDRNGDDGIHLDDAGNTLTKNHADRNVDLGIFAVPGNIDGGGNKAKHKGTPRSAWASPATDRRVASAAEGPRVGPLVCTLVGAMGRCDTRAAALPQSSMRERIAERLFLVVVPAAGLAAADLTREGDRADAVVGFPPALGRLGRALGHPPGRCAPARARPVACRRDRGGGDERGRRSATSPRPPGTAIACRIRSWSATTSNGIAFNLADVFVLLGIILLTVTLCGVTIRNRDRLIPPRAWMRAVQRRLAALRQG